MASFSLQRLQITSDLLQIGRIELDRLRGRDEKVLYSRFSRNPAFYRGQIVMKILIGITFRSVDFFCQLREEPVLVRIGKNDPQCMVLLGELPEPHLGYPSHGGFPAPRHN